MKWTKKDDAKLRRLLAKHGPKWSKIGGEIGRTRDAVRRRVSALGLKPHELDDKALVIALRKNVSQLESQATKLNARIGELQDIRATVAGACATLNPRPKVFRAPRSWRNRHPFPAGILVSDWQIGERIDNVECGGWGDFDYAVAERRVKRYLEKLLAWIETLRSGYVVRTFHVCVLGDMVSGNIHPELVETNEWPTPVAAVKSGDLLGRFLCGLAPHADIIIVHFVGRDNHGRLTRKPRYKKAAFDNWNYIVHEVAQSRMAQYKNVLMRYCIETPAEADLGGYPVLLMHGDQLKAWMGLPYYGMQREQGRRAVVHMEAGRPFRHIFCGHWHNPARPPGWIVNGSLTGTTELDNVVGRHAPPSQTSLLVHPKYGPFNVTDWNLTLKAGEN